VGIRKITLNQSRKVHVTAAGCKPLPAEVRSVTNLSNLPQKYTAIFTSDWSLSTTFNKYLIFERQSFFKEKSGTFVYNIIRVIK